MKATIGYLALIAFAAPSNPAALELTRLGWCDRMLAGYETCLHSVTRSKCENIARRDNRPRVYRQAGAAGEIRGARAYPSPADACLAEKRDLLEEAGFNAAVIRLATFGDKEKACRQFQRLVAEHSESMCGAADSAGARSGARR